MQPVDDLTKDLAARLDAAGDLIADGARFVHVLRWSVRDAGLRSAP